MATALESTKFCIIVVFGIPCAGKSFLSKQLELHGKKIFGENSHILHVCMDDFYPSDTRTINDIGEESKFSWKKQRQVVNQYVEEILAENISTNNPFLHKLPNIDKKFSLVIVIDDNLPLRSMRHEYYQLAKKYSCGCFSIYVKCLVDVALKRNMQRSQPLLSKIITTMIQEMEQPKNKICSWEKNFVIFDSTCANGKSDWFADISEAYHKAIQNPEKLMTNDESLKKQAQEETTKSLIHQADNILRHLVSSKMKELLETAPNKSRLQETAKKYNDTRKLVLNELQTGQLCDVSVSSYSHLQEVLILKFDQHLKT